MIVESRDGGPERRFLIGCVANSEFLSRVAVKVTRESLRSKWGNLVLGWCLDYHKEYGTAPVRHISTLYAEWAEHPNRDRETVTMLERFLASLSQEFTQNGEFNVRMALTAGEKLLNEIVLERLEDKLKEMRAAGQVEEASDFAQQYRKITLHAQPYIDIFRNDAALRAAIEQKQRVLVRYPGAAGLFFGNELAEDSFVAFMAPPKVGKSWMLQDIAWHAMRQKRRVAYFQVGDLSQNQIIYRLATRAMYRPLIPRTVRWPISLIVTSGSGGVQAEVQHEERVYTDNITFPQARRAFAQIIKKNNWQFRLSCHPIKGVSVLDIRNTLDSWRREGWCPQVVVIDYAWNLAPSNPKANPVDQVSDTWSRMRELSMEGGRLVVTANQTNKEGFKAWVLTRSNFADSKMILGAVTGFLGVNQTDEEKGQHLMRLNFVVRREEEFQETKCLWCASCLSVANPIMLSNLPGG